MESHSNNAEEGPSLPLAHMVVAMCCLVIAGCLPAPGAIGAFYVVLPYGGAVVATGLCLMARLGSARRPTINEITDQDRAKKLRLRLPIAATLCLMAAIGEVLFLAISGLGGGFGYMAPGIAAMDASAWLAAVCFVLLVLVAGAALFVATRVLQGWETRA